MKSTVYIQNLKCGGCANTITNGLNAIDGITQTEVIIDENCVLFENETEKSYQLALEKLSSMGYPEIHDSNSVLKKAKSYVSCAIGRMTDTKNEKEDSN